MTVNNFSESDYKECPACGHRFYRHVTKGDNTTLDTIGMHTICVTPFGTFFHGNSVTQDIENNE